jgi:hypothetical protein
VSRAPNIYLYFDRVELFKAEVAVLVTVQSATQLTVEGWISRKTFREIYKTVDFKRYGKKDAVLKEKLQPMSIFRAYLDELAENP